ncbi:hypothetical protein Esi_0086_0040 [Ectocarpus siliculosus]|uniref:Uncharacterized protein n=1 Tax=Ectocarpus siliculosus TaxID=2880 RepID=D7G7Y9_ECTSI|nr:hypothetical protein Esi_0086_0040 [Ectocarpus siliculosus]|eukprot:CBJ27864.1 hypothetical protein Esi_0086_0040 [Ectocarpus siliculosus]
MLTIVRGAEDVARARRANRKNRNNRANSATAAATAAAAEHHNVGRLPGQVGVAVRRGDNKRPRRTFDDVSGDYEYNPLDVHDGPGPTSAEPAAGGGNNEPATVDLTSERPEPVGGDTMSNTFAAFANPGPLRRSNAADQVCAQQLLGSWLQPVASPKKAAKRRRQRPSQGAFDEPDVRRNSATAWGGASSPGRDSRGDGCGTRGNGGGNDGTLSAWLEPRQPATRGKRTAHGTSVAEREPDGGFSGDEGGGEDGGGRWMSDRLEGLDPTGAARAKDSWSDRERRNLTCTDIALGAKRKGRGRGGGPRRWKTKARGTKGSGSTGLGRGRLRSER